MEGFALLFAIMALAGVLLGTSNSYLSTIFLGMAC